MLKEITTLQNKNTIAIEVKGKLDRTDYMEMIHPLVDNAVKDNNKIKALIHFGPDFEGFTPAAAWEDFKLGLHHWNAFAKIALVTDKEWLRNTIFIFRPIIPGEIKVFHDAELQAAIDWII